MQYRIRYDCWITIARSQTVPVHREPSIEMDEDEERDFEDYNYQPQDDVHDEDSDDVGHSAQAQAGLKSLVKVLVDSMEFTADELESAVHSIPTPSDSMTLERP